MSTFTSNSLIEEASVKSIHSMRMYMTVYGHWMDTDYAYSRCQIWCMGMMGLSLTTALQMLSNRPVRAPGQVVRIDPLRFLAGCRTRRLNQV